MIRNQCNAEHYRWGENCDGWHLVATPDLSVIEERMPPGAAERRHLHQRARQLFYVLSGSLAIEMGEDTFVLSPRDSLEVAPGVPHLVRNAGKSDAAFLVVSSPPSHGDREDL